MVNSSSYEPQTPLANSSQDKDSHTLAHELNGPQIPEPQSLAGENQVGNPLLEIKNLTVTFPTEHGPFTAVKDISFSVYKGEVLAIVGESGSGKSVSTQAVAGLLPPSAHIEGSIVFDGQELLSCNDKELSYLRGKRIAMIFQDPLTSLTPIYTIEFQIAEALKIHNPQLSRQQVHDRVIELLELVEIPHASERAKYFPHQFSGGMRQRVAIAMAIANNPELIIADEPTTALDVTVQAQILNVLYRAREYTGAAVIIITHDLGVVAGIADRALVMFRGNEIETDTTENLFAHPSTAYTAGLLAAIPRVDDPPKTRLAPIPEFSSLAQAKSPAQLQPRCETVDPATTPAGHVVLRVENLHKYYPLKHGKKFHAVKGISFQVQERETFAIVGESGSGKTTTILEIMKLAVPDEGVIELFGHNTADLTKKERQKLRQKLNIVFQDPMSSLDPRLPIGEIIAEPLDIAGIKGTQRSRRVQELMDQVGLSSTVIDRYPTQFSGGQRQRIGIARALALRPQLVVLDEPVSALDVSIQASVLNLLRDLQQELGLAYLFISHNLAVVKNLADHIAVMKSGAFVESGTVEQIFTHPQTSYTKALLAASPIPDPTIQRARLEESARLIGEVEFQETN